MIVDSGYPVRALAPWQAEPYRLWSLLDMLRFYAATFVTAVNHVQSAGARFYFDKGRDSGARTELVEALGELITESERLPLSSTLQALIGRISNRVEHPPDYGDSFDSVITSLGFIFGRVQEELAEWLFLAIPATHKQVYREPLSFWGTELTDAFPDIEPDLRSACRCFATDEPTAAVFHAMRATESALRTWAVELGLSLALHDLNWQDILNAADSRLRRLEQEPKSAQRSTDLEYFGTTSAHFRAIKNAWRNHVTHGRRSYDGREASDILQSVRAFMRVVVLRSADGAASLGT